MVRLGLFEMTQESAEGRSRRSLGLASSRGEDQASGDRARLGVVSRRPEEREKGSGGTVRSGALRLERRSSRARATRRAPGGPRAEMRRARTSPAASSPKRRLQGRPARPASRRCGRSTEESVLVRMLDGPCSLFVVFDVGQPRLHPGEEIVPSEQGSSAVSPRTHAATRQRQGPEGSREPAPRRMDRAPRRAATATAVRSGPSRQPTRHDARANRRRSPSCQRQHDVAHRVEPGAGRRILRHDLPEMVAHIESSRKSKLLVSAGCTRTSGSSAVAAAEEIAGPRNRAEEARSTRRREIRRAPRCSARPFAGKRAPCPVFLESDAPRRTLRWLPTDTHIKAEKRSRVRASLHAHPQSPSRMTSFVSVSVDVDRISPSGGVSATPCSSIFFIGTPVARPVAS